LKFCETSFTDAKLVQATVISNPTSKFFINSP
jgi:hypothetical protein